MLCVWKVWVQYDQSVDKIYLLNLFAFIIFIYFIYGGPAGL